MPQMSSGREQTLYEIQRHTQKTWRQETVKGMADQGNKLEEEETCLLM
jgi:hypothetical protein